MKRILLTVVAIVLAGCASTKDSKPYEDPFYGQFLNTGSELDARITATLAALRENPDSPALHNELGALLVRKDFPKDAAREFERAINLDSSFYPAWYNLGLVRAALGDSTGARHAFNRTVNYRKGHGPALFELGLIAERRGNQGDAVAHYAKALRHNPELLDVRHNPRVLDSKLMHLALIERYARQHDRESAAYQAAPPDYEPPQREEAPSRQPTADEIVTPAAPVTEQGTQQTPPPGS